MNDDEIIRHYGLRPTDAGLPHIREMLRAQADLDQHDQDTELMRLPTARSMSNCSAMRDWTPPRRT
ncbi:hypothetical protein [Micromonospora sp. WMMD1274]|uniref:hypothetical protein n=1 Tax=Micromonospora sp. WMMD1274 TaxID=3404116 RepID=UPI003B93C299